MEKSNAATRCRYCPESSSAPVTANCSECGEGLCPKHILECTKCHEPMCRLCWGKLGQDRCRGCQIDYNYWTATDQYISEHGGPPKCDCGEEMFAEDDHGRFLCGCWRRKNVLIGSELFVVIVIP